MTKIALRRVRDLTADQWNMWRQFIAAGNGVYDSPYFRPEFTQAVDAVRSDVEVAVLEQGGQTAAFLPFQRGTLGLGKPIGGKLSDYHGPILRPDARFDPRQFLQACRLSSWDFDHLVCPTAAFDPFVSAHGRSPLLDLSGGYAAYCKARRQAGRDTVSRIGQKVRKLAREVGPLMFEPRADDAEAYELLRLWKSAQYERTGLADIFRFPWTVQFLEKLRTFRGEEFSAPLAVLRAGDKVAAAALSLRSRGVLHVWFTAYNSELASYSPGVVLLLQLAAAADELGIRTIDLGRGDERYKWSLASTSVPVCEGLVSCPSLGTWLRSSWRNTRDWVTHSRLNEAMALPARLLKPVRQWMAYH